MEGVYVLVGMIVVIAVTFKLLDMQIHGKLGHKKKQCNCQKDVKK